MASNEYLIRFNRAHLVTTKSKDKTDNLMSCENVASIGKAQFKNN